MTRDELREWWIKETAHCKTFDEMADETARFITTNFKKRAVAVVVEDTPPPAAPVKKPVKKVVKKVIKKRQP